MLQILFAFVFEKRKLFVNMALGISILIHTDTS